MKVSVVVPVYGVEDYLDECVKSIVNQTYKNLEIILVDDGGKDKCPDMCDEWAKKDNRITVIHKENGGQGTARNVALDVMTGDYVLFVDGDDMILPVMVEKMLKAADNGKIDLVLCGLTVNNRLRKVDTDWYNQSKLFAPDEIFFEYLVSKRILTGPVCKLIAKSLIENIRFPDFRANEDAYIMHEILGNCNSAYVLKDFLYIQNIRDSSTEQSEFNLSKMHLIDCAYSLKNYVNKNYPQYKAYVSGRVAEECIYLLYKMYIQNLSESYSFCEDKIKLILEDEIKLLNKETKIYKEVYTYLNKKKLFIFKIRMLKLKVKIRKNIKMLIIRIKTGLGDGL